MIRHKQNKGFTVIELLVVLSIMTAITGIVLVNYRGYGANAVFANASEDLVLALREAQVYGVGVKGSTGCTAGSPFDCGYGVYFSTISSNGIIIFADNNGNSIYDAGVDNIVQKINWQPSINITSVSCNGGACGGNVMSVTFKRPNPSAIIHDSGATSYNTGKITISDGTKTSFVQITSAGQISLQ